MRCQGIRIPLPRINRRGNLCIKMSSGIYGTSWIYPTGKALCGDFHKIDSCFAGSVDAVITSPPFAGSMKFYIQNWLRLWCAGWEETDYKQADTDFLEAKQKKSMDVYYDFFALCSKMLKPHGKVILHLGHSRECNMADELEQRARERFHVVYRGAENVEHMEKHGIKDKGATFEHQYLFLEKR